VPRVECFTVTNRARAYAVTPYLTARETGAAIMAGLEGGGLTGRGRDGDSAGRG
jgi:hypothetical protein